MLAVELNRLAFHNTEGKVDGFVRVENVVNGQRNRRTGGYACRHGYAIAACRDAQRSRFVGEADYVA